MTVIDHLVSDSIAFWYVEESLAWNLPESAWFAIYGNSDESIPYWFGLN